MIGPYIPPATADPRRSEAIEAQNSVATRRSAEQRPAGAVIGVQDVVDLQEPELAFPNLDTITRRILKAMYDALEKAAQEAEERLRRAQGSDDEAKRQAEELIAQKEQAQALEQKQQEKQRPAAEPAPNQVVAGEQTAEGEQSAVDVPRAGADTGAAQQVKPTEARIEPAVRESAGKVLLRNVTQALREFPAAKVPQVHNFTQAPAPKPAVAPVVNTPAPVNTTEPIAVP